MDLLWLKVITVIVNFYDVYIWYYIHGWYWEKLDCFLMFVFKATLA